MGARKGGGRSGQAKRCASGRRGARIVGMSRATWLPFALLLAYGVAFASRAFGVAPLAFDDHPGQLARLIHVVREGPAPWAWNAGWWAGYPELQFYPPGWFYLAASLSWLSL